MVGSSLGGVAFEFWKRLSTRHPAVTPTGTYTDVQFPPTAGGYESFEWSVTPRTDPSPDGFFWSHQFGFDRGDQGYCGLQTHNAELGGKIAIFSVWSAMVTGSPARSGAKAPDSAPAWRTTGRSTPATGCR